MHCNRDHLKHHASGFFLFTLASVAMTLPFIFYAKDIANSARAIAGRKAMEEKC